MPVNQHALELALLNRMQRLLIILGMFVLGTMFSLQSAQTDYSHCINLNTVPWYPWSPVGPSMALPMDPLSPCSPTSPVVKQKIGSELMVESDKCIYSSNVHFYFNLSILCYLIFYSTPFQSLDFNKISR